MVEKIANLPIDIIIWPFEKFDNLLQNRIPETLRIYVLLVTIMFAGHYFFELLKWLWKLVFN